MGRSTPDRPPAFRPEPPPAPPRREDPASGARRAIAAIDEALERHAGRARCDYCRRWGTPATQCEGCGAPMPASSASTSTTVRVTFDGRAITRAVVDAIPPAFDRVRRRSLPSFPANRIVP
jgi:hypothetical protein